MLDKNTVAGAVERAGAVEQEGGLGVETSSSLPVEVLEGESLAGEITTGETPPEAEGAVEGEAEKGAEGEGVEGEEESVSLSEDQLVTTLDALSEMGIELGVEPTSVPEDLKPAYMSLVDAAERVADRLVEVSQENSLLKTEKEDLMRTFQQEPEKVLLTLYFSHPEAFSKVAEVAARANEDQEYKELVLKDLRAELALREARRLETVVTAQQVERLANKITARTDAVAKKHGVDRDLARKLVALAIQENGGRPISLDRVDQVVTQHAKTQGVRRKPLQAGKSPQSVKAAKQAPTKSVAGAQQRTGMPAEKGAAVRPDQQTPYGRIRGIVGNILRRQTVSE